MPDDQAATLTLPAGRVLGYAEYGDPGGEPGFYFHGHPGSRVEAGLAHEAAARAGIRVIALDRPGYGQSGFQPGRRILDWPADVAAAADALDIDDFAVLGASGGGPYALACGYRLPDRVTRVGVVSGVGPFDAPGATKGMRWQNRIGFGLGARFPFIARFLMWSMSRRVRRNPARVVDAVARAMSGPDAETVRRPEVRAALARVITEAFAAGHQGAAHDIVVLGRPWGFALEDVRVPVALWQGEEDALVPPAMGRYQAERIPNCTARFYPGAGHLLVIDRIAEVLSDFRPMGPG
jgi:pimeloyl-ACP methyl ester carboxylesterase